MMNEAKPFASLGPTLLARKGGARPAMRPQLSPLLNGGQTMLDGDGDELDDLGWNDMGDPDEDDREHRVIPIGLSPIGAEDDDDDEDEDEFGAEPALGTHAFADEEPEGEEYEVEESDEEPVAAVDGVPDDEPEEEAGHVGFAVEPPLPEPSFAVAITEPEPQAVLEPANEPEVLARKSPSESVRAEPRAKRRSAIDDGRRAAFTLRLDARRHLKLRLASTVKNRSAQQLVTQALDKFLAEIPEIEALAARVTRD